MRAMWDGGAVVAASWRVCSTEARSCLLRCVLCSRRVTSGHAARVGVGRHNTRHVTATTCHDSQELKLGMGLELELELELGPGLHVLVLVHRRVLVLQLARRQHRQDVRERSARAVPVPCVFFTRTYILAVSIALRGVQWSVLVAVRPSHQAVRALGYYGAARQHTHTRGNRLMAAVVSRRVSCRQLGGTTGDTRGRGLARSGERRACGVARWCGGCGAVALTFDGGTKPLAQVCAVQPARHEWPVATAPAA